MNFVNHFFEIHVFFPMSANHDILSISKSSKVIVEEKKKKKNFNASIRNFNFDNDGEFLK